MYGFDEQIIAVLDDFIECILMYLPCAVVTYCSLGHSGLRVSDKCLHLQIEVSV